MTALPDAGAKARAENAPVAYHATRQPCASPPRALRFAQMHVQLPNGELRMRWTIWLCSGALDSSLRHAKVMGSSCRSRSQSLARAREHDAEMTCVSEGTLESGGRRAPDREVFLSMDACVRGVPCVRGGLVDPISAGPFTPCKTLDGRRGLLRSREGGKTKRPRRASRTRVPDQTNGVIFFSG